MAIVPVDTGLWASLTSVRHLDALFPPTASPATGLILNTPSLQPGASILWKNVRMMPPVRGRVYVLVRPMAGNTSCSWVPMGLGLDGMDPIGTPFRSPPPIWRAIPERLSPESGTRIPLSRAGQGVADLEEPCYLEVA